MFCCVLLWLGTNRFGCQLDEPYDFPSDHEQTAAMFQCHVHSCIYNMFSVPVPMLYSVENKTYYYILLSLSGLLGGTGTVILLLEGQQKLYDDVIMGTIASQITSLIIVYSTVYSGADQSKHQSSASLAFVWGIHRGPVNSPHKWPVTRKMFPFDDVIMNRAHILFRSARVHTLKDDAFIKTFEQHFIYIMLDKGLRY